MGGVKKGKSSSKSKSGKSSKDNKPKDPKQAHSTQDEPIKSPQERVAQVRPYWESLSHEQRVELLTLDIEFLHQRAVEVTSKTQKQLAAEEAEAERSAAEAQSNGGLGDSFFKASDVRAAIADSQNLAEVLDVGVRRLRGKSTWKVWHWPAGGQEFVDAESFRQCVEEHIDEELRAVLPKEEGHPVERPAEAALRQRMCELLQKVHANTRQLQDDMMHRRRPTRGQRATSDQVHAAVRDTNMELITTMLEALEQEHEFLYHAVLYPITSFVCEMLPEKVRESTSRELFFEDLDRLAPEDVARICEWLTEKVDSFSTKIKPEAKEVEEKKEEQGIGDVDLFSLTSDKDKLTVNSKWFQHLQERLSGEDGHPCKVQQNENPHSVGLVLEWIYGTIVSTAEKARGSAKRALGCRPPSAQQAYDQLSRALQDQLDCEIRAKQAKELLNDMLESGREARQLAEHHDTRPVPDPASTSVNPAAGEARELPDNVIVEMLKREVLLTEAKLHALTHEHILAERKLRTLKSQLRQGEPEFSRLKRQLEDLKNQPRGFEGTYSTASERDRQKAQHADALIEEQLEVQTVLREHGDRLQKLFDRKRRTEIEMERREQEIKQVQGWRQTVQQQIDRFRESLVPSNESADLNRPSFGSADLDVNTKDDRQQAGAHKLTVAPQDSMHLVKLRQHFQKKIRRQLYNDEDERTFTSWIQSGLLSMEKRLEEGRAALQHLELHLINVACDDSGATIGAQLALPMLQERLEAKAHKFAAELRNAHMEDLLREEDKAAQAAEAQKKLKHGKQAQPCARNQAERLQIGSRSLVMNAPQGPAMAEPDPCSAAASATSSSASSLSGAQASSWYHPAVDVPGKAAPPSETDRAAPSEADGAAKSQGQLVLSAVLEFPAVQAPPMPQHVQNKPDQPPASAIAAAASQLRHHAEATNNNVDNGNAQPWITRRLRRAPSESQSGQTASSSAKAPSTYAPPVPTDHATDHGGSLGMTAKADEHAQIRKDDQSPLLSTESCAGSPPEQMSCSSPQQHLVQLRSSGLVSSLAKSKPVKQNESSAAAAAALSGGHQSSRGDGLQGKSCEMASGHTAGQLSSPRPRPMGLQHRVPSPTLAESSAWSTSQSHAQGPASAAQDVEGLPARSLQISLPVGSPSAEPLVAAPEEGSSTPRAGAHDSSDATQVLANMGDALAMVSQVIDAVSTSIRQAATWLGHSHSHSASAAQIQQVRECMRASKETLLTLQRLAPGTAAAAQAVTVQPGWPEEGDDDTCSVCLDQPSCVTFHPCGHTVTCASCAAMVTKAKQTCPFCRCSIVSAHTGG